MSVLLSQRHLRNSSTPLLATRENGSGSIFYAFPEAGSFVAPVSKASKIENNANGSFRVSNSA